jgi:Type ISP C-terminal specificity domain/N-6 DNA Methylase/TIR domain
MTDKAIELFYSYAHEDEALRNQLDKHLKLLQRQGYITQWHDRAIDAGSVRSTQIEAHLEAARIILLLVSPDFMASDYCYSIEMQEALNRHKAGTATVIPIILRPTYLKNAPFADLEALPRDAKPVTTWSNLDAAFNSVAEGISKVVDKLNEKLPDLPSLTISHKKKRVVKEGSSIMDMPTVPTTPTLPLSSELNPQTLKKAVTRYYKELKGYEGKADYELALRSAFQNLLADLAHDVHWTLIPEQTLEDGLRPDGVLRDSNNLRRGYWEAKGPASNLNKEIDEKIRKGYPLTNTVFENTIRAILYQNNNKFAEYDLRKSNDVQDLLTQFLTHTEPHIDRFQTAVIEFKKRIPALANDLLGFIDIGHKKNPEFQTAFDNFALICRAALNPNLSDRAIDEMLVQHLLTERLFRTVFSNADFIRRNIIAAEIEKVIHALTIHSFNRQEFFKSLDRYYVAIEGTAQGITSWTERQEFLNTVYEGFFQGFSTKQADVHGIVYTPQEIVDFMCASVEEVLKQEFDLSIADPGVKILDPATGTGNFIVNLIRNHIPGRYLKEKYKNDLFCNEITLLPYYIASLNIEHEYYVKTGEYTPFGGICFADTLELDDGQQLSLFVEENTERVQREKDAQIMVVIGNPPYNVGQKNENDNNKNRSYRVVDNRIRETYSRASNATLNNKLYDHYVRFFRWAADRLQGRDGIVCLVTNNSFIDQMTFDGMRMHLEKDFTHIYHLNLHGNVRRNPKLSGTTHNVFGIQVGVGITIAVRASQSSKRGIFYHRVPEEWRKIDKLVFLTQVKSILGISWQELHPDKRSTWLTEGLNTEFDAKDFLVMGTKDAKANLSELIQNIFKTYSPGLNTSRDEWVYDFRKDNLKEKLQRFVRNYNSEVFRWSQESVDPNILRQRSVTLEYIDNFVNNEQNFLKWTDRLKEALYKKEMLKFDESNIRHSLYRPFCKKFLYFDHLLNQRQYRQHLHFPSEVSERENTAIIVSDHGHRSPFSTLVTNIISDYHLLASTDAFQCFPYYTYSEDGTNRRENITDWSLAQFQAKYGSDVTKWDIFHYVYCLLHHPQYRERYVENLKRDLPHIPPVLHNGGGGTR